MFKPILRATKTRIEGLKTSYFSQYLNILYINFGVVALQFLYLLFRYKFLNEKIPFWYTLPWGDYQLGAKSLLFILPVANLLIIVFGVLLVTFTRKLYISYLPQVISSIVSFTTLAITFSLGRIIFVGSTPFPSLINPLYFNILPAFLAAFGFSYFGAPFFISFIKEKGIITNPSLHKHPAMVLQKPSARGGGVFFALVFLLVSLFFVGFTKAVLGIFIVVALLALLGLADDYQNTHPNSFLDILETPLVRLVLLFFIVSLIPLFGVKIGFIGNPFGGILDLGAFTLIPSVITVIWMVWILNLLSWSNGIDGQYSGIIGIASIVVALLALRFVPLLPEHVAYARMAIIAAGVSFGLIRYTWHPSQIMWGFSATAAGLVLASVSIMVSSKIAVSIIIILIPFLDAVVTIVRRVLQKKNPLKGDRGHLHHLLLDRGWSPKKIAVFYWITTTIFGVIALVSSEKYILQITLLLVGIVASFIILMNLQSLSRKQRSQEPGL